MGLNINQVFMANPSTTLPSTALIYSGLSPFGSANDTAITVANLFNQFTQLIPYVSFFNGGTDFSIGINSSTSNQLTFYNGANPASGTPIFDIDSLNGFSFSGALFSAASSFSYLGNISAVGTSYITGTASQTATTVTGVGTTFTAAMVNGQIRWPSGTVSTIKTVNSGTSLTVLESQSQTSSAFTLYYGGWNYDPIELQFGFGTNVNVLLNQIDTAPSANTVLKIGQINATLIDFYPAINFFGTSSFSSEVTISGSGTLLHVLNSSAGASGGVLIESTTGVGNPYLTFLISGNDSYSMGILQGSSQVFAMTNGATVGSGTQFFNIANSGAMNYFGSFTINGSSAGTGATSLHVYNSNASSLNSQLLIECAASGGSPYTSWYITGGNQFSAGIDPAASNIFKFSTGNTPAGGTLVYSIDHSGVFNYQTTFNVNGTLNATGNFNSTGAFTASGASVFLSPIVTSLGTAVAVGQIYNTGTASQTSFTITGIGTTFSVGMVGGIMYWPSSGDFTQIAGFTNSTTLTASTNVGQGAAAYQLIYNGWAYNNNALTFTVAPNVNFYANNMDTLGSGFSLRLGGTNAQSIILGTGQQVKNTSVTTATYTTLITDYAIFCNRAGVIAITLLTAPNPGTTQRFKDISGAAATNNITITPATGTIDGASTLVINTNYGAVDLIYNGSSWSAF